MNEELIDEIAFKAGCYKHHFHHPKHPDLCGKIISQEALNKFAELIVKECIGVIGEENYTMLTGKAYCTKLKRHFGVEE